MASEADVQDACNRKEDNVLIEADLTDLASIFAGTGDYKLLIERDGVQFNLSSLRGKLIAGSADEATAVAAIETGINALVGATEVAAGTIRKALRDLVDANDADIAAT